ncbi:MAG TPA: redoxin domain-containing protein, partial [Pirellulales bacterium]|nr:redoxin domain-containing protein [Pirellulales bacterium]
MIRNGFFFCLISFGAAAVLAGDANVKPSPSPVAAKREPVINFSLLDYRGKYYELRRTDARVVVLYFVGLDCPIARQSIGKLQTLQKEFKDKG